MRASGLWKRFGDRDVVRDVSLAIESGETVGFVGPNGSGKTTTIRMLLDILSPDRGDVAVFGSVIDDAARRRIGYLPEERGLYRGLRVMPTLRYLAELKGVPANRVIDRALGAIERLELHEHKTKKVGELSRGLSQLLQFAATIQHAPDFVVLDEPFSGLDPVNVRLMKTVVGQLRRAGAAILFSTHQMTDVEELSDRVIMIHEGAVVLNGAVREIRRRYAGNSLLVESSDASMKMIKPPGVQTIERRGHGWRLTLTDDGSAEGVLRALLDAGIHIDRFERMTPTLEEIFLSIVGGTSAGGGRPPGVSSANA